MKRLESNLRNMVLSLTLVTALAGALLAWVHSVTEGPVAEQQQAARIQAVAEVAPAFDNDPEVEKWATDIEGLPYTVYPARRGGELVGAAVMGSDMNGFAGEITVMCGFDASGTVTGYRVLKQAETPGLGTKMETWFRDPAGARSVIGKNPSTTVFRVTKDNGGQIDGITAATISSRAFLAAMRRAYDAYVAYTQNHKETKP